MYIYIYICVNRKIRDSGSHSCASTVVAVCFIPTTASPNASFGDQVTHINIIGNTFDKCDLLYLCVSQLSILTAAAETWRGGSPSTYTRSMCMWYLINKRWVHSKHSELKWERAPKKVSFLKEFCFKSANCSQTLPKIGLSVTNSLVYGVVARQSAHELSHD